MHSKGITQGWTPENKNKIIKQWDAKKLLVRKEVELICKCK